MFFFFHNAGTPFVDPTARILKLIELLRERASWYVAKKLLERHRVPVGNGWDNTIENVKKSFGSTDVDGLMESYLEQVYYGEKSVRFYELGAANRDNILNFYSRFQTGPCLSLPLTGKTLQQAPQSDPTLVFVSKSSEGITAVYSSIRKHDERTRLSVSSLPVAAQKAMGDFEEIIGIQSRKVQSFDVVFVPFKGTMVEVRVDSLGGDNQDTLRTAHQHLYADIHSKSGSSQLISPVDLFAAIKPMYDDKNEGSVIELAFATTTGSIKHEKMRDKDACLRKEVYHVNGKAALKADIEPYRIGLRWILADRNGVLGAPELFLEGRATMAAAKVAGLHSASIKRCRDAGEYIAIKKKIESYI